MTLARSLSHPPHRQDAHGSDEGAERRRPVPGRLALLAFAVGAIIRVAAGALASVLGLLLVVEVLFRTLPVYFFRQVSPFLPSTAGHQLLATQASIEQARATSSAPVLDPWVGFSVMAAWVAVALVVAAVQLRRRDA
jgi:ABC-2 type transport system permease protein